MPERIVFSSLAMNFGPPPAHADKQEAPIVKKLRLLALEGMADELERPSRKEKHKCVNPQAVNEDGPEEQRKRNQNCRNPQGVAYPVDRVLMAAGILRDPLFIRAVAEHSDLMIYGLNRKAAGSYRVERPGGGVLASLVLAGCSTLAY